MKDFKLVIGCGPMDRLPKKYMKMTQENGSATYHNLKEKIHSSSIKYGPYNTIKQQAIRVVSYNVGREVDVIVKHELDTKVDYKLVAIGFNF